MKNPSATEGVQVKFELPLQDNMETDFSQLYFSKTDDLTPSGRIPYWIESADAASAVIWVKLPAGVSQILLSWGVDSIVAAPSGDDTFEFFDDFTTDTITNYSEIHYATWQAPTYMEIVNEELHIGYSLAKYGSAFVYANNAFMTGNFTIMSTFRASGIEGFDLYRHQKEIGLGRLVTPIYDSACSSAIEYTGFDTIGIAMPESNGESAPVNSTGFANYTITDETRYPGVWIQDMTSFEFASEIWLSNLIVRKYVATQPEIIFRVNYRALFSHRATITVTDPSATEGVQAMFELPLLRDMAVDYADIRFSTTEGRALYYWIEATDIASAIVWIKLPATDSQVYMYWGTVDAISESNADAVFDYYEDFSAGTIPSDWHTIGLINLSVSNERLYISRSGTNTTGCAYSDYLITPDVIYESHTTIGVASASDYWYSVLGAVSTIVNYSGGKQISFAAYSQSANAFYIRKMDDVSSSSASVSITSNIAHTFRIENTTTGTNFYVDDISKGSLPAFVSTEELHIGSYIQAHGGNQIIDWIRVRKYAATQPVLTLSAGYTATDLNQHTIAVQYPSAVADVQVLFTFYRRYGMQSDYSDLRFAGWGSENREYWIESANAASAAVWINLPANDTFIYYYWGDDTAVAASSGSETMDAFVADDLTDWDVYTATDCTVDIVETGIEFHVPAEAAKYAYIKSKTAMTGEFIIESVASFSHQDVNANTFSSIGLGFPYYLDGNGVVIRDYSSGDTKIAVEQKTGETTRVGDVALIGDASTEDQRYYLTSKDDYYVGYLTDTGSLPRLVETDNKVILGITTDSGTVPSHDSHVYTKFAFVRKYVEVQPILTQGEFSDAENLTTWGRSVDILLDVETVIDNQQVLVKLPFLKNMQDDFSDVRFSDADYLAMPYWLDSKQDLITANIWVNVPTSGSTSIKCLYKKDGVTSISDGPTTFDVFDHFEGTELNEAYWYTHEGVPSVADSVVSLPEAKIKSLAEYDFGYAIHAKVRRVPDINDSVGFNDLIGHSRESITTTSGSSFMARNSNGIEQVRTVDLNLAEDTDWHIRDVAAAPNQSVRFSIDNELLYTETDPTYVYASGSLPVTLDRGNVDWFAIRKAVSVEPVATVNVDALYTTWEYSDVITFDIPTIVHHQLCSVVITARDGMKSDFSDLRFATRQGTELRYAMEPPEYTSSAKFWLEVQSIGTTEVIAFWGNASAEDESEWDELFPIMHEFFEDGIDAEKWPLSSGTVITDGPDQVYSVTVSSSTILQSLPITTTSHQIEFEVKWTSFGANGPRMDFRYDNIMHYVEIYANGTGAWHDVWLATRAGTELSRVERPWSLNTWYTYKIVSTPTSQKLTVSNNNINLIGSAVRSDEYTNTIYVRTWDTGSVLEIKDIKVRPYIAQDPVLSFPDSIGTADDILTDFVAPITGQTDYVETSLIGLPDYYPAANDLRERNDTELFEYTSYPMGLIDGGIDYIESLLDGVWTDKLASDDETRERTTPSLTLYTTGNSGPQSDIFDFALEIFQSSTSLKRIGSALRTSVRQRPGKSTRMDTSIHMILGEPLENIPLLLDGHTSTNLDDSYIEGFKLPIIAHVNRISGAIFPNAVVILEGGVNKILTRTDYRGIIIDWIPFDTYDTAIFVSTNNIVYTQLSKEEVELYVFNYIINRASLANAPFRMVHTHLG